MRLRNITGSRETIAESIYVVNEEMMFEILRVVFQLVFLFWKECYCSMN